MHRSTSRFKITCAVLAALTGGVYCAPTAWAQPANGLVARNDVAVTEGELGLLVDVNARDVAASAVIEKLAKKTNLDFIIYDDAQISLLQITDLSPADALKKIVEAADLSVQLVGKTYVVEKKVAATPDANNVVDLYFRDVSVRELLLILQEQFGLKIEIAPQVAGELVAIHLNDETPISAVEKIARGAKLSLTQNVSGVYRIGFDNAKTPEN